MIVSLPSKPLIDVEYAEPSAKFTRLFDSVTPSFKVLVTLYVETILSAFLSSTTLNTTAFTRIEYANVCLT